MIIKQVVKKMKKKFNVFDVIIILVIIAAFFVGSRILGLGTRLGVGADAAKVTFAVEVRDARKELFTQMQIGDTVNISLDSVDYATVTEISTPEPSLVQGFDSIEGKYKFTAPDDSKYTAFVALEADGYQDESSVYVGSSVVKVGQLVYVKGKGYSGRGYVIKLDTK